jgi:hypothetical protein
MRRLLYRLPFLGRPKPKTVRGSFVETLLELFRLWP